MNRILVVDDVPENIQILLNFLKDDFIVVAAANGEKALEIAKKEPFPDLIILDILMPEMSGYEVCKQLKNDELTKEIPIIFISVLDDISATLTGFEVGGVDYISKPFDVREVLTRVKTHIELSSQRKALEAKLQIELIERQKQEDRMIQQEKMAAMGEMLALIAHQWKQPLNSINTIAAGIKINALLKKDNEKELVTNMEKIEKLVMYLSDTIGDFSNFFKANKPQQNIYLQDIIEKSVNLLSEVIKQKNIDLDYSRCHFKDKISVFANELIQVILSIVKNAIDAASDNKIENPKVTITGDENDDEQIIYIQDNCGGISQNQIDEIFKYGFSTKSDDEGSGLGLHMSKIIVENHCHGKITAKNSNGGMLFSIHIPKAKESI